MADRAKGAPIVGIKHAPRFSHVSAWTPNRALFLMTTMKFPFWSARRKHAIAAVDSHVTLMLAELRALVDASRVSSLAVLEALGGALARYDGGVDAVLVYTPNGDELECVLAIGSRAEHYRASRLRRDAMTYLPARAAIDGHRAAGTGGFMIPTDRAALAVPMHDRNGLCAVVYLSSSVNLRFECEEMMVMTIEHAASAYALALERESDRAHATYDALTGLLTPRAFRSRLRDEVERSGTRSATRAMTLWFVDTDHFKAVNDEHGHAAGDRVLQAMADLLRAHTVADVDVAARNGGDEFCALIFDAQKTLAIERANELCKAVRTHDFGVPLRLTASIGVATFPYDARSASELLEVADAAMYHSKRSGRDRVSFSLHGSAFSVSLT
jgi:diguanylate cyclase (GGDEF)-like protein